MRCREAPILGMQSLRAFVTLLPAIACSTTPEMHASWVEIAYRAGDLTEAQRSLNKLIHTEPSNSLRLAKRLNLQTAKSTHRNDASESMKTANKEQAISLADTNKQLRRPAFYRLLQLKEYPAALPYADHPMLKAMAFYLNADERNMEHHLHRAANDLTPPLYAVRAWRNLRALQVPESSVEAQSGWQALTELKAPTEALKRAEKAPKDDCLRRVVESLAFEQIGRPAASADAALQTNCLPAQIQHARLLTRLRPAAAKLELEKLAKRAPLDHNLLTAMRQSNASDSALSNEALNRIVAWYPADHNALRDRLTQLERDKDWALAHQLCERSLQMRDSDEVHLLSLRYLALSGARHVSHDHHRRLAYRLEWLKRHRPQLQELTQIQALIAGADEEGGGLGAAATQLKPQPVAEPTSDSPSTVP